MEKQTNQTAQKYGEIIGKDKLFMYLGVGSFTAENGEEFKLAATAVTYSPLITRPNGSKYLLRWEAIIRLAETEGFFDDEPEVE